MRATLHSSTTEKPTVSKMAVRPMAGMLYTLCMHFYHSLFLSLKLVAGVLHDIMDHSWRVPGESSANASTIVSQLQASRSSTDFEVQNWLSPSPLCCNSPPDPWRWNCDRCTCSFPRLSRVFQSAWFEWFNDRHSKQDVSDILDAYAYQL
jgi:hypothetical protein